MITQPSTSTRKRSRGAAVLMGPPGLFLVLTIAALIAGISIARSTTVDAAPKPAHAAADR
jgi:hypothetical protein